MFNQLDYPTVMMQDRNKSVAAEGCGFCSALSTFRYFGATYTVPEFNTALGTHADLFDWAWAPNASQGTATWDGQYVYDRASVVAGVYYYNEPVIVYLTKGSSTHFVAVYKVWGKWTDDNSFYIRDPWGDRNYQTIGQYVSNGWTPQSIFIYHRR